MTFIGRRRIGKSSLIQEAAKLEKSFLQIQGLASDIKHSQTIQLEHFVLLDEISWMGTGDSAFPSLIKDYWDLSFKKNPKLIFVLCGSVSSWIEDNILKNTAFEGRISLEINLRELSYEEICEYLLKHKISLSALEKLLILSITGGVPKYLEEINLNSLIDSEIARLAFTPHGFFLTKYNRVFTKVL